MIRPYQCRHLQRSTIFCFYRFSSALANSASSLMLSPRAKAFTVQNLLRLDTKQQEQKPVPAQLVCELPYEAAPGWIDVRRKTDRREPVGRLRSRTSRETWCTCHDVECTSLCRHPSVITTAGEYGFSLRWSLTVTTIIYVITHAPDRAWLKSLILGPKTALI